MAIPFQDQPLETIADAFEIAKECNRQDTWTWLNSEQNPNYLHPFGILYRGQRSVRPLVPSVFRDYNGRSVNETSIFYHFQLRSPQFRQDHRTAFEWLSLMQHYGAPTRLLDWSESVLVALYFAVERPPYAIDEGGDGELFVLNAALLNSHSDVPSPGKRKALHIPESYNVVVRSVLASYREVDQVFMARALHNYDETDAPEKGLIEAVRAALSEPDGHPTAEVGEFLENLRKPVAVFPYRANSRLLTQQGAFTVHGGKFYNFERVRDPRTPIHFEDFSETPFLRRYHIPADCKKAIREGLNAAGIHKGSLFPELDQQSEYMRTLWLQPEH